MNGKLRRCSTLEVVLINLRNLALEGRNGRAFDEFLRLFVIVENTNPKKFVIDDDKVHRSSGHDSDRCGLQEHQHVRDNRRGFTAHHIVQSASQILAGIKFDGYGDTTLSSTICSSPFKTLTNRDCASICPTTRTGTVPAMTWPPAICTRDYLQGFVRI